MKGKNGAVYAYGEVGTGKTFTLIGVKDYNELEGMLKRASDEIFDDLFVYEEKTKNPCILKFSMIAIYWESTYDWLSSNDHHFLNLSDYRDSYFWGDYKVHIFVYFPPFKK